MADSVVLKLQKQIEFYFSDANLRHDTFLSTQMKKSSDNYVDLEVIARCNAVKSLTKDRDVIRAAIHLCADLELSDDGQKVRRISSLPEVVNLDDQTIFVDNIPQHADHATVKKVFNKFGTVEYISIPRYPGSGNNKGFAFVEFDSHQAAERAVKAFQDNSGLDQQVDMGSCSESLDKGVSRKKRRKRNRPSSVDSAEEPDSLTPPKKRAIPDSEVANSVAADNCNEKTVEMRMETEGESKTEMQESVKAKDFIDVQKLRVMPK
jgi:La-related protein 7